MVPDIDETPLAFYSVEDLISLVKLLCIQQDINTNGITQMKELTTQTLYYFRKMYCFYHIFLCIFLNKLHYVVNRHQ